VNRKIWQYYGIKWYKLTEVTANRPDIIMKNKKRENMHAGRCGNTCGQNCRAKGSGKEAKVLEFMYRDTANVEHAMCDCTGNMWSHWNSYERFKEQFGNHNGVTFSRFSTKDSCSWNIIHNMESAAG
jgi:hypothetical protein